jgi:hypothetical protein
MEARKTLRTSLIPAPVISLAVTGVLVAKI